METMKAIASRKSVRTYKQDQIPDEVLNTILIAGSAAPVASGMYDSLHLTVIQDKEILAGIAEGILEVLKSMGRNSTALFNAPTLVIASSKTSHIPGIDYANVCCVLENMVIAAADQEVDSILFGLGVVAVQRNDALRKALAIPDGFNPLLALALGYGANPDETVKEHKISMNRV